MLTQSPQRMHLAQLAEALTHKRQRIARAELDLAVWREDLSKFEAKYEQLIAPRQRLLLRSELFVRHIMRQMRAIEHHGVIPSVQDHARHIHAPCASKTPEHKSLALPPKAMSAHQTRRKAYLQLARVYHPDLADPSADPTYHSAWMALINHLYRIGDTCRLVDLAAQLVAQKPGQKACFETSFETLEHQIAVAQNQCEALDKAYRRLLHEASQLGQSATYALFVAFNHEEHHSRGQSLWVRLTQEVEQHITLVFSQVGKAFFALEQAVQQSQDMFFAIQGAHRQAAKNRFAQRDNNRLMRLGLEQLNHMHATAGVKRKVEELKQQACREPGLMRLILLTYIMEVVQTPLDGLASYETLAERLEAAGQRDERPWPLTEALIHSAKKLCYAAQESSEGFPVMALRFVCKTLASAVPHSLRDFHVRRLFFEVLLHLGDIRRCNVCQKRVFSIPLYHLRGLSDIRALVCPFCTHAISRYVLPKGCDIQAVLNAAYLDFDVIEELSVRVDNLDVTLQFLPKEMANASVAVLLKRLAKDLFERHGVMVQARALEILDATGQRLSRHQRLAEIATERLELVLPASKKGMALGDLVAQAQRHARSPYRATNQDEPSPRF